MRIRASAAAALMTSALCGDAGATTLTLLEQDRGCFAAAMAVETDGGEERSAPDEATDFLPFEAAVADTALTQNASASAAASLASSLAASRLEARGSASVSTSTLLVPASAEAPADSFFEATFLADDGEAFTLRSELDATAEGGSSYASVELVDVDTREVLTRHSVTSGESGTFTETGELSAGTTYRLRAFSLAHARSSFGASSRTAEATFEAALQVPEPAQPLGAVAAAAVFAGLVGARRRRAGARAGGRLP